ncbi:conserved hypothetical protein (plasmid) [Acidithiobacillus caldus SM-1]|uniref:Uncharacterized protein n=1 Tax=Acidithiobacillus caldus (strain SM-1) TaxID=990288 RepID=F9ZU58_ACICS|nr:conserved hypothetical protein [Acidithiobacillus caldus SM-1]
MANSSLAAATHWSRFRMDDSGKMGMKKPAVIAGLVWGGQER